jgi:PAS domain S-box-containing protein
MKISFSTKIAIAMGLGVFLLAASAIQTHRIIDEYSRAAEQEERNYASIRLATDLVSWVDFTLAWLKGYHRTGDANDLREYDRARAQVRDIMKGLLGNTVDARRKVNVEKLEVQVMLALGALEQARRVRTSLGDQSPETTAAWHDAYLGIEALTHAVRNDLAEGVSSGPKRISSAKTKEMALLGSLLSFALLLAAVVTVVRYERRQQRARAKLSDSKAMTTALMESMAEGMIASRDGVIIMVNEAAVRMFGFESKERMLGVHVTSLVPERQRDDFQTLLGMLAEREDGFHETGLETRALRQGGDEFPAKVSFSDVRIGGQRIFTAIVRDMSNRQNLSRLLAASEARLREITDAVPALIYYTDDQRRVRFHNRMFREWIGVAAEEVDGRMLSEIIGAETYESIKPHVDQVFNGYPVNFERRHRLPSGAVKDLNVNYYPRYDEENLEHVAGFFALVTDITELKRIDRMKSEFVSTVSHELRTPLTSIRGSLGLISGGVAGPVPEAAKSLVDIAQKNCDRLIRLINDILDTEKIESGKMAFKLQATPMKPLLEQVLAANEGFGTQHGVGFTLSAPTIPLHAYADSDRLMQVLTNLVSNAVKFSPRGSDVAVSLSRVSGRLRVEVSDRGPGIPENFRHRIFQKFSQADASDTRQKGGTGLGLNISRAIVERMGGSIGFQTEVGSGTTFYFELPEAFTAREPVPAAARPHVLVCEKEGEIARILHVEDDPDIQRVAAAITKDFATFEFAATLGEARERLAAGEFDLVLLDLSLPDGSGWALMNEIEGRAPNLPVVIFSASEVSAAESRGAAAVLLKSNTSNELLSHTIHRALDERTLQKAA